MLSNIGRTFFPISKSHSRQTKNGSLIQTLTEDVSSANDIPNNRFYTDLLPSEHGQEAFDKVKAVVKNFREYLITGSAGTDRKQNDLTSVLSSPAHADKPAPTSASSTFDMMTNNGFALSKAALGLSIASFFFKPLALGSLFFVALSSPSMARRIYQQVFIEHKLTPELLAFSQVVVGFTLAAGTGFVLASNMVFTFILSLNVFLAEYAQKLMRDVRENAKESLVDVFKQQPTSVWVLTDGMEVEVPVESLKSGDLVVVNAGETIPIDGQITKGLASVDQHILTGEAQPAEKEPGDQVFALTMVASGKIQVLVEKTGEETTVAQIGQILNQTMNFKTEMQLKAENVSRKSILPTLVAATVALPFLPTTSWALLLTHPKHKGTVATYINILSYLDVASKQGILLKDGRVLEILNDVDTVVFDKTGTLTETQPHVGQVHTWSDYTEEELLTYAAAAEYRQTHPLAHAIIEEAEARELALPEIEDAAYKVGYGLTVMIDGITVRVGSLRFMQTESLTLPPASETTKDAAHNQGHSLIFVGVDAHVIGAIELEPTVRPEAEEIIQGLRERGIESTYIISGDHEAPTRTLANKLGIDHYFAETLPEDKANIIDQLQQDGKTICYIGDGINDAIALKTAAVSISLQGASSVAVDTAQVVLMDQSLNKLCTLFDLAADFQQNMKKTFGLVVVPHLLSLAGVLFLHFGLLSVIILCQLGFGIGVGNALLPRLEDNLDDQKKSEDKSY